MYYPAIFTPDTNGTLLVTFRDIPEAITVADNEQQAQEAALAALLAHFGFLMEDRTAIPTPSEQQEGEHAIYLPASVSAKLALYHEMISQKVSKAELARRLKCNQKQIDRLWDLNHASKLEALEKAFLMLGKRLSFTVS
ncbi:type II toxin-antitoxin system HicB family antitoxin [Moraxella sp. ZJ142]|uniref:type II toxin-antitoxin system HicB family antitoxin n=1 Tax=Moraxella marmotae TaxID=3344520 RepID=UPI0035D430F9